MLQKDNRYKILEIFFQNPLPKGIGFQLRELSRKTHIAPPSVKSYLIELSDEKLIRIEKHRIFGYPVYTANRENDYFKSLKKIDTINNITKTGLLQFLSDKCAPDAIILFGSSSRGEDTMESDIDIFILSKEEKLDLQKYEKLLFRKINAFFSDNFLNLSKELKNNILNGIILKGYLKVF